MPTGSSGRNVSDDRERPQRRLGLHAHRRLVDVEPGERDRRHAGQVQQSGAVELYGLPPASRSRNSSICCCSSGARRRARIVSRGSNSNDERVARLAAAASPASSSSPSSFAARRAHRRAPPRRRDRVARRPLRVAAALQHLMIASRCAGGSDRCSSRISACCCAGGSELKSRTCSCTGIGTCAEPERAADSAANGSDSQPPTKRSERRAAIIAMPAETRARTTGVGRPRQRCVPASIRRASAESRHDIGGGQRSDKAAAAMRGAAPR